MVESVPHFRRPTDWSQCELLMVYWASTCLIYMGGKREEDLVLDHIDLWEGF